MTLTETHGGGGGGGGYGGGGAGSGGGNGAGGTYSVCAVLIFNSKLSLYWLVISFTSSLTGHLLAGFCWFFLQGVGRMLPMAYM